MPSLIQCVFSLQACETQLKLLPVGLDNLNLIPEETRKAIYDASRRPPEGYEIKHPHKSDQTDSNKDGPRSQVHTHTSTLLYICAILIVIIQKLKFKKSHTHT